MSTDRFELDFTPRSQEEKRTRALSGLIGNVVEDFHLDHPEMSREEFDIAMQEVEKTFRERFSETGDPHDAIHEPVKSRRMLNVMALLAILAVIAMACALLLIRRP